jgi:hypothetical protein
VQPARLHPAWCEGYSAQRSAIACKLKAWHDAQVIMQQGIMMIVLCVLLEHAGMMLHRA